MLEEARTSVPESTKKAVLAAAGTAAEESSSACRVFLQIASAVASARSVLLSAWMHSSWVVICCAPPTPMNWLRVDRNNSLPGDPTRSPEITAKHVGIM